MKHKDLSDPIQTMKELGIEDLPSSLVFLSYVLGFVDGAFLRPENEENLLAVAVQKGKEHLEEIE